MINLSHNKSILILLFPDIQLTRHHIHLASRAKPKISAVYHASSIKTQRPPAISNLAPLTPDTLPAADTCSLHQALLFYFFFFFLFCNFQKIQCIFSFWIKHSFLLFCFALFGIFYFLFLNLNMQDFFRKGKFLREKLVVEFGWREDTDG